ncbi:MAG: hypothetical protein A3G87_00060 [Omnitrophica bacterium RIFCSPLOWO2_12_FULL_50_11]|nr:MAG: hypothetical protein A3G87_00060 [Omnitrophica bacterium RIFCSPLOWO2_12_FULL_50_11]
MAIDEILKSKREDILWIVTKHRARNVRVFGSMARGEAGPGSDVDFLVEMDPGHSLLDRIALMLDLEQLLERRVDVATERVLRPGIRQRVLKEALPL